MEGQPQQTECTGGGEQTVQVLTSGNALLRPTMTRRSRKKGGGVLAKVEGVDATDLEQGRR